MNRLGLFAHYDAQGEVKDYVLYLLARLRPLCRRLIFVSTATLDDAARRRALTYCDDVQLRENVGFDFAMWKEALSSLDVKAFEALLLVNSSIFGPVFDLEPIVRRMEADDCDFWSMTESHDIDWHLQSYFLAFKPRVLHSQAFAAFWETVRPWPDKMQVIRNCEVGLSAHLRSCGFAGRAAFPTCTWRPASAGRPWPRSDGDTPPPWLGNPTACYPGRLLDCGMPFVKVNALRDNPCAVLLGPVWRRIRRIGYDEHLIQFDRPRTRRVFRSWLRHPLVAPVKRILFRPRPR